MDDEDPDPHQDEENPARSDDDDLPDFDADDDIRGPEPDDDNLTRSSLGRRDRRDWQDEDQQWHEAEEEYHRQLEEEAEAERREDAISEMEEWFSSQFEEPENETPYDNETGEYIYVWGGPFDASDVIADQFGHKHAQKWIDAAVERIEQPGTIEWSPRAGGEYYDPPEPDDDVTRGARRLVRDRILSRLDELEHSLRDLSPSRPSIGHNYPPGEVGLPPYNEESRLELKEAARATREEVTRDTPDVHRLEATENTFRRCGVAILRWIGRKLDLAVDESIKAGVKAVAWGTVATLILGIADDLGQFIRLLTGG